MHDSERPYQSSVATLYTSWQELRLLLLLYKKDNVTLIIMSQYFDKELLSSFPCQSTQIK